VRFWIFFFSQQKNFSRWRRIKIQFYYFTHCIGITITRKSRPRVRQKTEMNFEDRFLWSFALFDAIFLLFGNRLSLKKIIVKSSKRFVVQLIPAMRHLTIKLQAVFFTVAIEYHLREINLIIGRLCDWNCETKIQCSKKDFGECKGEFELIIR
jgi:hypothetical protein